MKCIAIKASKSIMMSVTAIFLQWKDLLCSQIALSQLPCCIDISIHLYLSIKTTKDSQQ